MATAKEKGGRNSGLICATTQLAVVGWLAINIPSAYASYNLNYYPYSYLGPSDFRDCAAGLLKVKLSADEASTACSQALRPRELSSCVVDIKRQTDVAALDALNTCRQARRPNEVSSCVIGISKNSHRKADPADLNYCGSTLLPMRFADCVVGLRRATKELEPLQAMNSCSNATDQIFDLSPNFVPQNGTQPIPYTIPGGLQNQTPPNQSMPIPTNSGSPGSQ